MKGKNYFVISNEDESIIKCEYQTQNLEFNNVDLNALEYGGNISSFIDFENVLSKALRSLQFSSWPWNKSTLIFLLPSNCSEVVKRAYFDSADFCDSKMTYLCTEYQALIHSTSISTNKSTNLLILNFDHSKFDITYSTQSDDPVIRSYNIASSFLKSITNPNNGLNLFLNFIDLEIKAICSDIKPQKVIILGYNKALSESIYDFFVKNKIANPILLPNKIQILMEGMEIVVKTNPDVLIRRVSI